MRFSNEPRTDAKRNARSMPTVASRSCLLAGAFVDLHGDEALKIETM